MDVSEAINITTLQLTPYKGLYLPPRDYMSCQPLIEEWEPRIPNIHKYNDEIALLVSQAKLNGNKLPIRVPLTYLAFHHQFSKEKESNENNELKLFSLSKVGMRPLSNLAKKRFNECGPMSAFKFSENSLINFKPLSTKIFSNVTKIESKAGDTTKENTSWRNRSNTYRFHDEVKSDLRDNQAKEVANKNIRVKKGKIFDNFHSNL